MTETQSSTRCWDRPSSQSGKAKERFVPWGSDDAFLAVPDWSPSRVITGGTGWGAVVVEAAAAAYESGWEELVAAVTSGPVAAAATAVAAVVSASELITSSVKVPAAVLIEGGRGAGLSSTPFIDLAALRVRGRVLTPPSPWLARRCFLATVEAAEVPMGTYKSERCERATRRSLSAAS